MDRKRIIMGSIMILLLLTVIAQGLVIVNSGNKSDGDIRNQKNIGFVLDSSVSGNERLTDEHNRNRINNNLSYLESIIDEYFLYDATESNLETGLYKGVIGGLNDPYSVYYTPKEYENMLEKSKGAYSGIGAVLTQDPNTMLISIAKLYEKSPAVEGGLLPEDIIVSVNDTDISQMELSDVVLLIKGQEGTSVKLKIYRKSISEYKEVTIIRKNIEFPTLTYQMLEDKIGYIYIATWEEVTTSQYIKAMEDLESQGMKKLIVDLRDNPGGVFTTVCQILDYMVEDGETLVYTLTKEGEKTEIKGNDGHSFNKPLVVLVNGNSASASEIFAGGIKDYGTGIIIGTTTYGKGIVQRFITLGSGAAIKLTVSEYYLPSGVCIHKTGIRPDIEIEVPENQKSEVTISKEDDNQLQKAIETLNK
ncbi:MAG: S41 family peptidase [Lachnospiraceae bacterium]|nr:S41 family peptidase [Lachnospiraceae bacterium]